MSRSGDPWSSWLTPFSFVDFAALWVVCHVARFKISRCSKTNLEFVTIMCFVEKETNVCLFPFSNIVVVDHSQSYGCLKCSLAKPHQYAVWKLYSCFWAARCFLYFIQQYSQRDGWAECGSWVHGYLAASQQGLHDAAEQNGFIFVLRSRPRHSCIRTNMGSCAQSEWLICSQAQAHTDTEYFFAVRKILFTQLCGRVDFGL
jgi:hypothetical protein